MHAWLFLTSSVFFHFSFSSWQIHPQPPNPLLQVLPSTWTWHQSPTTMYPPLLVKPIQYWRPSIPTPPQKPPIKFLPPTTMISQSPLAAMATPFLSSLEPHHKPCASCLTLTATLSGLLVPQATAAPIVFSLKQTPMEIQTFLPNKSSTSVAL